MRHTEMPRNHNSKRREKNIFTLLKNILLKELLSYCSRHRQNRYFYFIFYDLHHFRNFAFESSLLQRLQDILIFFFVLLLIFFKKVNDE